MKTDITRNTFNSANNFSRVIMQQGRVQLDADWNEQADILLHYLRALAEDIIGPHGGPAGRYGFSIGITSVNGVADLAIGQGRYYVAGLLCEAGDNGTYFKQPFYPLNTQGDNPDKLPAEFPYLVYMDVWERAVSSLDYPNFSEVALGGADTAMRSQVVWQIKTSPFVSPLVDSNGKPVKDITCDNIDSLWSGFHEPRGMLKARVLPQSKEADPCLTSPESSYRGAENQLYRVEVYKGGLIGDKPTFKWSRDNGSVVAAWLGMAGNDLTATPVRDSARGFASGQWIELSYDEQEWKGLPGTLVQLAQVSGDTLTIEPPAAAVEWSANFAHPKVRRWDQQETDEITLSEGAIPITEPTTDDWITLEDGIQIQFQPPVASGPANIYRSGDYWLIPARTATGDVEWPKETNGDPAAQEPDGIEHFYAPLAAITGLNQAVDLRHRFGPLGTCDTKLRAEPLPGGTASPL